MKIYQKVMYVMSMPKYMHNGDAPISIVVKIESLSIYIFRITNNERQFGKAFRYTLVTDLRNTCLKLHKVAYQAVAKKPKFKEDYEYRKKKQQKMLELFIDLKALLIISAEVANISNLEYLSKLYDETFDAYNKWVKNDRRMSKKALTEIEYREMQYKKAEKRRKAKLEWDALPRDTEGFVVLNKKVS